MKLASIPSTAQGVARRLADRVALVTGGSRGIGAAIVKRLAAEGAQVVFTYLEQAQASQAVAHEVRQAGGWAEAVPCDLRDQSQATAVVEEVVKARQRLDIVVNNAGIVRDGLFLNTTEEDWTELFAVNLMGAVWCAKAALPQMLLQSYGRIINISSVVSELGGVGQTNYAASKGALNGFTRALAVEVAAKGVTVNAVAPGLVETDMLLRLQALAGDRLLKLIPIGRLAQADDVAAAVAFLASEEAGYITGHVMVIDGGLSLQGRR